MKIKKKLLMGLGLCASLAFLAVAHAQLAGTERINGNHWFPNNRKIQLGNLPNVNFYYNGTNPVLESSTPLLITGGVSAPFTPSGMMTFSSGVAVTAGSYQVGRDADGTNQLHFNGPTGSTMEWSINDTAEMTLSATLLDVKNNAITTTGVITGASIVGPLTGNASTATALAANPTDCAANQFSNAIAANGNLTCAAIVDADIPDALTISGGTVNASVIGGVTPAAGTFTTILGTSSITSSATGSIGWSIQTGANTDCNTTCTFACVHGWDTSSGEVAVDCADATADKCL